MNVVAACLSLAVFMGLMKLLRVDTTAVEVLAISRRATAILRNPRLNDDIKERMARRYSFRLLARFFFIVIPGVIAGAGAFGVLMVMDALHLSTVSGALDVLSDWVFVTLALALSVVAFGTFAVCRRWQRARHEV